MARNLYRESFTKYNTVDLDYELPIWKEAANKDAILKRISLRDFFASDLVQTVIDSPNWASGNLVLSALRQHSLGNYSLTLINGTYILSDSIEFRMLGDNFMPNTLQENGITKILGINSVNGKVKYTTTLFNTSVNTTDDIIEGTSNLFMSTAVATKISYITITGPVDLDQMKIDVTANNAKVTNVTTNLSEGTTTNTTVDVNSSDGTNATLAAASTSRAGVMTKAKFDEVVANTAKPSNNLATGNLTQAAAARSYNMNNQDLTFSNGLLKITDTTTADIFFVEHSGGDITFGGASGIGTGTSNWTHQTNVNSASTTTWEHRDFGGNVGLQVVNWTTTGGLNQYSTIQYKGGAGQLYILNDAGSIDLGSPNAIRIGYGSSGAAPETLCLTARAGEFKIAGVAGGAGATTFKDLSGTKAGIEYHADYSSTYNDRSLVDKAFVLANAGGDSIYTADGTIGSGRDITITDNVNFGKLKIDDSNIINNMILLGYKTVLTDITNYNLLMNSNGHLALNSTALINFNMNNVLSGKLHNDNTWSFGSQSSKIGSAKVEIKGSGTSNATHILNLYNSDSTPALLFDSRSNGQFGFGGIYVSANAYTFRNPAGRPTIARFDDDASNTTSFTIGQAGSLMSLQSGSAVFYSYRQGGVSWIKLFDAGTENIRLGRTGSWINSSLIVGSATGTTGSRFEIQQASTNIAQQLFFANARVTTAGRLGSDTGFGSAQAGFECYDTTLNKKFFWNGTAWEQIDSGGGGSSIYTTNGTLSGARTVTLNGNDLSFLGNAGLNIDNTSINNNKALISLSKGMSNSDSRSVFIEGAQNGETRNYWKIFSKGSFNFTTSIGIGFYQNNTEARGTEYTLSGIRAINDAFSISNYSNSTPRFRLFGGTTDVTGTGYLKFWNYNASSQKIQISRSGKNFINPDTLGGFSDAGLIVMGDTYISTENISLQGHTAIKGANTLSTASALQIYDGDGTPNSLWDFRNNGDVYLGQDTNLDLTNKKITFKSTSFNHFSLYRPIGVTNYAVGFDFSLNNSSSVKTSYADIYSQIVNTTAGSENSNLDFRTIKNGNLGIRLQINPNSINMPNLPTSASGLSSGDLWNDNSVVRIGTGTGSGVGTKVLVTGSFAGSGTLQTLAVGQTKIEFDDSVTGGTDVSSEWDNSTHRFTVGASGAGVYIFQASLFVESNPGWGSVHLKKNGTQLVTQNLGVSSHNDSHDDIDGSVAVELAVGDYVEFWANWRTSTGAIKDSWGKEIQTFSITKIGDTTTIINADPTDPRITSTASTATLTINSAAIDQSVITAQAEAITIAAPTGSPVEGRNLIFRFKDNGTARAITWNAIFRAIGITLPTTTTASKLLYVGCKYNSVDTKWDVVSVQEEA